MLNKLCVVSICKNEEYSINAWLNSFQYCDALILIDTGSTDATLDIIKSRNLPNLYLFQKEFVPFDFSEAHNYAAEKCRELIPDDKGWLFLSFDIDEQFLNPKETSEILRNIQIENWDTPTEIIIKEKITNDLYPDMGYFSNKIHTFNKGFKWEFSVHETRSWQTETLKILTEIIYVHNQDKSRTKEKKSFYNNLLKEALYKDRNNYHYVSWYATEGGELDLEIMEIWEHATEITFNADKKERGERLLQVYLYWIDKRIPGHEEAFKKLITLLLEEKYELFKTFYRILGDYIENKFPDLAIYLFEKALALPSLREDTTHSPCRIWSYETDDHFFEERLMLLYFYNKHDYKKALYYAGLCYSKDPSSQGIENLKAIAKELSYGK